MSAPSRRNFLKGSALFLGAAALQHAAPLRLYGMAAGQSGALGRPLRMLAIGDSVMWGQGLQDEHKFTHMLREWLCEQRGGGSCRGADDVQLHVEAHSGAHVANPEGDDAKEEERFKRDIAPVKFYGEVNNRYPTNWGQLALALRHYRQSGVPPSEVDLVLVNGGINDMSATNILVNSKPGDDIMKAADTFCEVAMRDFLYEAADKLPNARFVVTGYFPLVSTQTCTKEVFRTLTDLLRSANPVERFYAGRVLSRMRAERADATCKPGVSPGGVLRWLADRSAHWVEVSNAALGRAVDALNRDRPRPPVVNCGQMAAPPEAFARGIRVEVPFKPENAYAAPDSWLWQLTTTDKLPDLVVNCLDKNLLQNLVTQDEMQGTRPCMCDHAGRRNDLACVRAGTFHPNRKGSNAYFEAIRNKLSGVACHAGWVPAPSGAH